jgi:hypothetical protein
VRTEQARENSKAFHRARQRALHRTAMRFHAEFDKHKPGDRVWTETEQARAMRAVAKAHQQAYRRFLKAELGKETRVPLKTGPQRQFPCGTERAWLWHRRWDQDPNACPECVAGRAERYTQICEICERPFVKKRRTRFCGDPCAELWRKVLSYYANFTKHEVAVARSNAARGMNLVWANRVIEEFARTGKVQRQRLLPRSASSYKMAEAIGVDLDALVDRFMER